MIMEPSNPQQIQIFFIFSTDHMKGEYVARSEEEFKF